MIINQNYQDLDIFQQKLDKNGLIIKYIYTTK